MEESHGEGVATHTGPESCASARKGGGEAGQAARPGSRRQDPEQHRVIRRGPQVDPRLLGIGISRALARVPGANLHLVPPGSRRLSRDAPLA